MVTVMLLFLFRVPSSIGHDYDIFFSVVPCSQGRVVIFGWMNAIGKREIS